MIRSEVGHQTGLKHTPSLTFVADTLPEGARHMEDLVARAREADAPGSPRCARARCPAGDPTRIRQPPGAADDDDLGDDDLDDDELGDLAGDGLDGEARG